MKKLKVLKENIVIICEGSETENNYFEEIKRYVEDKPEEDRIWSGIKIVPKPKDTSTTDQNRTKESRNKRKVLKPIPNSYYTKEDTEEQYKKYKAQPTRYVREAQLFKEEEGYAHAWAVFDRDQFTDFENAYQLAKEAGVGIAFSNLAFEMWVLFHFEKNETSFRIVECKSNDKPIGCGTNGVACLDGEVCLCGYVRSIFSNYTKDLSNLYKELKPNMDRAYENAAWSRFINRDKPEMQHKSPYTDVDRLVKLLLEDTSEVVWGRTDKDIKIANTTFNVGYSDGFITVTNTGKSPLFLPKSSLTVSEAYFKEEKMLLEKNEYIEANGSIELKNDLAMPFLVYREAGIALIVELDTPARDGKE